MSTRRRRRRGSIYLAVLGAALIVMLLGVSALVAVRVQRRASQGEEDMAAARLHARSALEMGLLQIAQDPTWRTSLPNGTWIADQPVGGGTLSLTAADPVDGDISDSPTDPLVLTGTGVEGQATHKLQVTLSAVQEPMEALSTCLHAAGGIEVKGGKTIWFPNGMPLSTNGNLHNDGQIAGDVEAASCSRFGLITGNITIPAPPKALPEAGTFEKYKDMATVVPFAGDIDKQVLSPAVTPWGVTNPDGVYFINTGGSDIHIKNSRIHGTLVIRCTGKKVFLEEQVLLHAYREDFPALLVDGDLEVKLKSRDSSLSEDVENTNFNPAAAPYEGVSDDDQADTYPNDIRGLVYVTGEFKTRETAWIRGAVICQGAVIIEGANRIYWDDALTRNPPVGYTRVTGMQIVPGSLKRAF